MMNTVMEINGLKCTLNMPKALKNEGSAHGLPPYNPRKCSLVDDYAACPDNWMHGSAKAASYFVPVESGEGMWLDLNANQYNSHYVAALISIQGVNPLTGQKTKEMRLEQYRNKCPKHDIEFGHDLYCEKCKFKWNPQNYLASNVTPCGLLWLDGFRNKNGEVRQWVFTEETAKGVAAQLIGNERVFAIGIAFYLSKQPKPQPKFNYHSGVIGTMPQSPYDYWYKSDPSWVYHQTTKKYLVDTNVSLNFLEAPGSGNSLEYGSAPKQHTNCSGRRTVGQLRSQSVPQIEAKALEIGAGAKINQQVYKDTENLDFWQEEPAGFLYVNYCTVEDYEKIIAAGKKDLTAGGEGFLADVELTV